MAAGRPGVGELRALELFQHLPEAKLAELAGALETRAVAAGAVVYEEGSPGDALFLLSAGEVGIDSRVEGRGRVELARLAAGDIFGDLALIERQPRAARAVARTDAVLLVLGRERLVQWLQSDPHTAVDFFVELLRVMSRRLRRSYGEVVLLSDLGELALQRFDDAADLMVAAVERLVPHLGEDWSVASYLFNEFNDEVTRAGAAGPRGAALPETLPLGETASRWIDAATFCAVLAGGGPAPLGFLLARAGAALHPRAKAETEVALTAAGRLLASALLNIRHATEERLRARLQRARDEAP